MKYFKLPDLGEGLTEAEIVEWHVKAGDQVQEDQVIVSVETAKAIVELPSPVTGRVIACFGDEGDVLHIGDPLVEYDSDAADTGTVVGELTVDDAKGQGDSGPDSTVTSEHFIIGASHSAQGDTGNVDHSVKATPSVRALARRLDVDLTQVVASGPEGRIVADDVEKFARLDAEQGHSIRLKGVRRTMAKTMAMAHQQVVPVTIFDQVDVHKWQPDEDVTSRLIKAIAFACEQEPALNVWFDGEHLTVRPCEQIDLAIAVDTDQGLFVPVLRDIGRRGPNDLKRGMDQLRADVEARTIPPKEMLGATITLSNFGSKSRNMAGRYATPVVVPPTVAILGAGALFDEVVVYKGAADIHPVLPLSLSFDHRAVTGGEAARFMGALIKSLKKKA